eukprot:4276267-Pleurochrysis_carterae.AAC.1
MGYLLQLPTLDGAAAATELMHRIHGANNTLLASPPPLPFELVDIGVAPTAEEQQYAAQVAEQQQQMQAQAAAQAAYEQEQYAYAQQQQQYAEEQAAQQYVDPAMAQQQAAYADGSYAQGYDAYGQPLPYDAAAQQYAQYPQTYTQYPQQAVRQNARALYTPTLPTPQSLTLPASRFMALSRPPLCQLRSRCTRLRTQARTANSHACAHSRPVLVLPPAF